MHLENPDERSYLEKKQDNAILNIYMNFKKSSERMLGREQDLLNILAFISYLNTEFRSDSSRMDLVLEEEHKTTLKELIDSDQGIQHAIFSNKEFSEEFKDWLFIAIGRTLE